MRAVGIPPRLFTKQQLVYAHWGGAHQEQLLSAPINYKYHARPD
jgi:hypothetical protein